MKVEQTLHNEIQESQKALDGPIDDTIYRRDHSKRIELINWVLESMKNQSTPICEIIETRMKRHKHGLMIVKLILLIIYQNYEFTFYDNNGITRDAVSISND
jgi:hypothetical protein